MPYPDRTRFTTDQNEPATTVTECPFCHASRVTTTSKTITRASYWRCLVCGEVWNPSRSVVHRQPARGW